MTDGPVVLIGPMGAGKTSIGKKAARRMDVPFADTDKLVVARHGAVAEIFATHGEERFRELEHEVVAEALAGSGVVSLGGGAVLHPATRGLLADLPVVLLTVTAAAVAPRLGGTVRPLLAQEGIVAWRRIAAARDPLYRELADLVLDTSHRPVSSVVDDLVTWTDRRRTAP